MSNKSRIASRSKKHTRAQQAPLRSNTPQQNSTVQNKVIDTETSEEFSRRHLIDHLEEHETVEQEEEIDDFEFINYDELDRNIKIATWVIFILFLLGIMIIIYRFTMHFFHN